MKIKKCLCFLALVIIVLVIAKCDFDTGLGLMKSRLSGRIVFLNPVLKADYVDAVRVVAVVNFPPETLGDVIFSNSVDISADTVYYSIPAPHYLQQ